MCIINTRGQINNTTVGMYRSYVTCCGTDTNDITWCDGEKRASPQGDCEVAPEERTLSLNPEK